LLRLSGGRENPRPHSSGSAVNNSGMPASLARSIASVTFVSAISRVQTTTTADPNLCAVIITR